MRNERDAKLTRGINWTKVRFILVCTECGAKRCIFSLYAVGNAKGSTKEHMEILQRYIETNGYICGDEVCVYANGDMKAHEVEDGEEEEMPILFFCDSHVC